MNYFRKKILLAAAGRMARLLPLFFLLSLQAAEPAGDGRWLLVFDTSTSMKKLQPEVVAAAKEIFTTSAEGQLRAGDSMAIWTVNQRVASQFQPFTWSPDQSDAAVSNLTAFLQNQPYTTPSQLAALRTPLNGVVAGSRQLTAVIFTDGQSDLGGTPYDEGINQTFREFRADRSKAAQLFLVVLRSDRGKFVGCTMNFPPGTLNLPPFPVQPVITNKPVLASQPNPLATNSGFVSLEIVGNSVSTNGSKPVESFVPKSVVPVPTNVAAPAALKTISVTSTPPAIVTNPSVAPAKPVATNLPVVATPMSSPPPVTVVTAKPSPVITTNLSRTNSPMAAITSASPAPPKPTVAPATTAQPAPPPQPTPPAPSRNIYWVLAGVCLLALIGGVAFLAIRRPPQSSLISASMDDEKRPRR